MDKKELQKQKADALLFKFLDYISLKKISIVMWLYTAITFFELGTLYKAYIDALLLKANELTYQYLLNNIGEHLSFAFFFIFGYFLAHFARKFITSKNERKAKKTNGEVENE